MRRETADFLDRLQRRVDKQDDSSSKKEEHNEKNRRLRAEQRPGPRNCRWNLELHLTKMIDPNELRQLTEEGSVARVVQAPLIVF